MIAEHAPQDEWRHEMQPAPGKFEMLDQLMHERRSVRGFDQRPVAPAILQNIFATAQQAPSNCNVQPWVVHVVSGDAAERMRTALYERAKSGAQPTPDFPLTGGYPGEYRTRQIGAAKALFAATGVAREDVAARTHSFLRNFRFFDAPHAAFIFMPRWAGMREAADCGMYTQSLMLAITAQGLGSCAQGALSHHADVVRDQLSVPEDMLLLFGLSFGYEDTAHPANAARTMRATLDQTTIFHD
jgi:nitroreductase